MTSAATVSSLLDLRGGRPRARTQPNRESGRDQERRSNCSLDTRLGSLALAKFGPGFLWDSQPVPNWTAIVANLAVGAGWIVAHARYLQRADELQRKIMLDAMAVALGVGLVGGFAYAAANDVDLIAFDANIAFFSALMGVVYMVAIAVENLRYR